MHELAKNISFPASRASVHAMIQYNGSGYHRHRLRDIRVESAFLEMGNARVLRKDSRVRVVFVHRDLGRSLTHMLEARVTRVEKNGARIEFVDLDDQAQQALSKLQNSPQAAAMATAGLDSNQHAQ